MCRCAVLIVVICFVVDIPAAPGIGGTFKLFFPPSWFRVRLGLPKQSFLFWSAAFPLIANANAFIISITSSALILHPVEHGEHSIRCRCCTYWTARLCKARAANDTEALPMLTGVGLVQFECCHCVVVLWDCPPSFSAWLLGVCVFVSLFVAWLVG